MMFQMEKAEDNTLVMIKESRAVKVYRERPSANLKGKRPSLEKLLFELTSRGGTEVTQLRTTEDYSCLKVYSLCV